MGDLRVDGLKSPPVVSPEEMAGRFHAELIGAMPDWKRQLAEDPSRLTVAIERSSLSDGVK